MTTSMTEVMAVINRYARRNFVPRIAMVLGSGLSSLAEQISNPISIPYQAIPGLHAGGVAGHASLLVMGELNDVPIVCLRGRLHFYEGNSYQPTRLLVHLVRKLGASVFIVTGAVGSLQPGAGPGEIMMINDHINFQPGNALIGPNDETVGPRFLSLENLYDQGLQDVMENCATRLKIPLYKGVYISVSGPSFETPAEIRAFRQWGADAVGMSVVPEVILGRHSGMRIACLTAITNMATGMGTENISHDGTLHYGEIAARKLTKLIPAFIKEITTNGMV